MEVDLPSEFTNPFLSLDALPAGILEKLDRNNHEVPFRGFGLPCGNGRRRCQASYKRYDPRTSTHR